MHRFTRKAGIALAALGVVSLLTVGLAAIFSSPDDPAITMSAWAKADPADVIATATGELAGTTTSARSPTATVVPLNTTARPAVRMAMAIASSPEAPRSRSSRQRTMTSSE